ncbi:hypothetical protein [Paraflavitalea pollutisoli]|uniref:hypothetical protein n=1 Tax=Paraflavitalea pollutisoli TaxID=3034143 RepID=UPI0023EE15C8|nr:hypothetical protein [Paraflavitalea sp. H1-2-19X]
MVPILQTETVNAYGDCRVENGDCAPLQSFEFNAKMAFGTVFEPVFTVNVNRVNCLY